MGKSCKVFEWSDGSVKLVCQGVELPYCVFDKEQRVTQADIVENKRLGHVLSTIREKQKRRDAERLKNKKITKREKVRIKEKANA